jgi:hypothetical protein
MPPGANGSALVATIQILTLDVRCRESKSAMAERQVAFACEAKKDRLPERRYGAVPQFWRFLHASCAWAPSQYGLF